MIEVWFKLYLKSYTDDSKVNSEAKNRGCWRPKMDIKRYIVTLIFVVQ